MKAALRRDPETGYIEAETADAEDKADAHSDLNIDEALRRRGQRCPDQQGGRGGLHGVG